MKNLLNKELMLRCLEDFYKGVMPSNVKVLPDGKVKWAFAKMVNGELTEYGLPPQGFVAHCRSYVEAANDS